MELEKNTLHNQFIAGMAWLPNDTLAVATLEGLVNIYAIRPFFSKVFAFSVPEFVSAICSHMGQLFIGTCSGTLLLYCEQELRKVAQVKGPVMLLRGVGGNIHLVGEQSYSVIGHGCRIQTNLQNKVILGDCDQAISVVCLEQDTVFINKREGQSRYLQSTLEACPSHLVLHGQLSLIALVNGSVLKVRILDSRLSICWSVLEKYETTALRIVPHKVLLLPIGQRLLVAENGEIKQLKEGKLVSSLLLPCKEEVVSLQLNGRLLAVGQGFSWGFSQLPQQLQNSSVSIIELSV